MQPRNDSWSVQANCLNDGDKPEERMQSQILMSYDSKSSTNNDGISPKRE